MLFNFGMATGLEKKKTLNLNLLKIDPISHPIRTEGRINTYIDR